MFSKTTEYALRAVIFIGQKGSEEKKLGLSEISAGIGSPPQFTAKILQLLTRNHTVVSSTRGPNGGFFLTEEAKNLPARAIIDAIGESEVLTKCVLGLYQCSESQPCPMHNEYKPIRKQLISLFESKTIRQLATDTANGKVLIIKG
jgi:Rrf2 family protein